MRRIAALFAAVALVIDEPLLLTGCSASAQPIALKVSVFQYRSDYAPRQAQIEIHNPSAQDLTITSATFRSAWFSAAVSSKSTPSSVFAKSTTDFPVVLAGAECASTEAKPVVTIRYTTEDGAKGSYTTTPTIPFHSIATVHAQDCSLEAFEKVATITMPSALRFEQVDGKPIALLDVTIAPTGAPGSVTLHSTQDTTLLAQREGDLRSIEQTFTAAAPTTVITLDYAPTRCEQHIVAEDKVGTVIPMHADAGGFTDAEFGVPVSAAVKTQFLNWVGVYCGW